MGMGKTSAATLMRKRTRPVRAAVLCTLVTLVASAGSAQVAEGRADAAQPGPESRVGVEPVSIDPPPRLDLELREPALVLRGIRRRSWRARRRYGWALLGWGLASVAVGTTLAIVEREDPRLLWAGLTTAMFGGIDAGLAFPLLDLRGRARRELEAGRFGAYDASESLAEVREGALRAELRSGQVFALNTGLDVFYLAAGALLWGFGAVGFDDPTNEERLIGAGAAMVTQSVFLLVADIIHWRLANRHAREIAALPRERPRDD